MATSHRGLKRLYNQLNEAYFGGALPRRIAVVWEPHGACDGVTWFQGGEPYRVCVDPALRGREAFVMLVLLHEMVHVKLGTVDHGRAFRMEQQRLWRERAFEGLV